MPVAHRGSGELEHATAAELPSFLDPGDVLVVNTSSTLEAAVRAYDGELVVHLSTHLGAARWVVEVRRPCGAGSLPNPIDRPTVIALAGGAVVRLRHPHGPSEPAAGTRLWEADVVTPVPRSEEHTSELQSLMRISYAVFCLQKKNTLSCET